MMSEIVETLLENLNASGFLQYAIFFGGITTVLWAMGVGAHYLTEGRKRDMDHLHRALEEFKRDKLYPKTKIKQTNVYGDNTMTVRDGEWKRSKDAADNLNPTRKKTKTRKKRYGTFGSNPKIGGKK